MRCADAGMGQGREGDVRIFFLAQITRPKQKGVCVFNSMNPRMPMFCCIVDIVAIGIACRLREYNHNVWTPRGLRGLEAMLSTCRRQGSAVILNPPAPTGYEHLLFR
jgi:hypothetical protein